MTVARSRGPPERDRLLIEIRNRSINADDRSTRPFVYPFPSTSPLPAMTPTSHRVLSTAKARRSSALESALRPIAPFLDDDRVVEVMLNADGAVWVDRHGKGVLATEVRMSPADSERMLRLVAAEVLVELNAQRPSLSARRSCRRPGARAFRPRSRRSSTLPSSRCESPRRSSFRWTTTWTREAGCPVTKILRSLSSSHPTAGPTFASTPSKRAQTA